jgi:hypothetical protein
MYSRISVFDVPLPVFLLRVSALGKTEKKNQFSSMATTTLPSHDPGHLNGQRRS